MLHLVTLRVLATVENPDGGSPDEAARRAQDLCADVPLLLTSPLGPRAVRLGLDVESLVSVIGEGEDPPKDE
jgi:hypothetical protein